MNREAVQTKPKNQRYALLDGIRGITLLSMICYHGVWDLVHLFGMKWNWYKGPAAYVWQQSICWTFIFLSGFCWPLGKKPLKRGFIVLTGSMLITAVTCLIMPESRVIFGVLSLIGSGMLLMVPLDKLLKKIPPEVGIFLSFLLFALTRNINRGFLGFESINLIKLPKEWYQSVIATYFGFTSPDFFSTDYFSLFPWLFLFVSGYFLCHIFIKRNIFNASLFKWNFTPLSVPGRYSFWIYLLHQPVLYLADLCIFELI
ncbi:MAG: heparan-alpha-glucosaminide N-acetyltransferase domain-containing protein [Suilimivivens sp.]